MSEKQTHVARYYCSTYQLWTTSSVSPVVTVTVIVLALALAAACQPVAVTGTVTVHTWPGPSTVTAPAGIELRNQFKCNASPASHRAP